MGRRTALLLALACTSASGCIQGRLVDGNDVPAEHVARIRPGETTKDQVLDWFGAPESATDPGELRRLLEESEVLPADVLEMPLADVLVFELTRVKVEGLVLLVYNRFDVRAASDRLVVFFDDEGRVVHYGFRRGTDALE
jgi:hypothetical protein